MLPGFNLVLRNIGATLLGLFVGSLFNGALISLNAFVLFPMPAGASMEDPVAFQAYLDTLPTAAFLVVMVAPLGQASLGGGRVQSPSPREVDWLG